MKNSVLFILILCALFFPASVAGEQNWTAADFTVLDQPAEKMMEDYLKAIVDRQFAFRDSLLGRLKTVRDWDRRAQAIRDSLRSWTGPLPEKTPLNARITGRIERRDYRIEKLIYESRPGFPVSASLYLPKNRAGPLPAVLNVIGHSPAGKASVDVQRRSIAQARKGFVALTIDGLGQGERRIGDYASCGRMPGSVHRVIGMQAFLSGTHLFNFMVWDAIRAVDYLCSRPGVDPERIGCTGTSGGGMMTTYILPFEPRINTAVPVCNPNTWSHRVHARLATDHEQVFFGAFESGIDPRGDPLFAHVPKPLLINATTDDNLNPPRGVWALAAWLYKAYAAHGAPEKFQATMVKAPHAYNREQREITYGWMLRWLGGDAADFLEGDFAVEIEEDLWSAPQGDLYAMKGTLEPHDLVKTFLESHKSEPKAIKSSAELETHRREIAGSLKEVLRIAPGPAVIEAETAASREFAGGRLTPVILEPEAGIILPGAWIDPRKGVPAGPVVLYLHDKGKAALEQDEQIARSLLGRGYRIFAVDLRGMGETAPGMESFFWDFLAGRPILGQRVGDVCTALGWLQRRQAGTEEVYIWASGVSALAAAMAAALTGEVSGLVLEDALISFESAVTTRLPAYNHEIILPGVLRRFDLPDIYQALAPRRVSLINPLLGDKSPAAKAAAEKVFTRAAETYRALQATESWSLITGLGRQERQGVIIGALEGR